MNATDTVCNRPLRNEGYVLVGCAAVLGTIAFLTVLVRLFVGVRQKSLGYDDLFACPAAFMSVPNSIGLATSAKMGLGRDIWTLTPFEITRVQKVGTICLSMRVNSHISLRSYTSAKTSTSGVPDSKNCVSCFSSSEFSLPNAHDGGAMQA
jgi:hypothetical protein